MKDALTDADGTEIQRLQKVAGAKTGIDVSGHSGVIDCRIETVRPAVYTHALRVDKNRIVQTVLTNQLQRRGRLLHRLHLVYRLSGKVHAHRYAVCRGAPHIFLKIRVLHQA